MPRIYVASLTDYNAGELHGKWIDAAQDADEIMTEVEQMLADSPTAKEEGGVAEEWAIHDSDDFGGVDIGEWDSFERVSEIAHAISEWPSLIVAHYISEGYDPEEMSDKIRDLYCGEFKGRDVDAVADMIWDDLDAREDLPLDIQAHITAISHSMARDDMAGGEYITIDAGDGTSYVLSSDR
ncbi:antirestriction protein ArdA [Streptomyces uncialis]|uniref:antirestriction protein ArdA n=1 Tax=Streptomyces uncialis TaxID=1048205 RepID=UPI00093BF5D7|nr:antirestriction protein ArdA [Streptomyces uncialis]